MAKPAVPALTFLRNARRDTPSRLLAIAVPPPLILTDSERHAGVGDTAKKLPPSHRDTELRELPQSHRDTETRELKAATRHRHFVLSCFRDMPIFRRRRYSFARRRTLSKMTSTRLSAQLS